MTVTSTVLIGMLELPPPDMPDNVDTVKYFARRLPIAALACGLLVSDAHAQQVRDSAGAKIIRYAAGARPRANWTVDPKPILRIGGAEGEGPKELAQVLGVARLSDGRLVIADGGSSELRLFSPTGAFVKAMGRKGDGPGEFSGGIQLMLRSADTLVVHDRQSRLQSFGPDGTLLRSYARPIFPGRTTASWPGMLNDGSGVVQAVDPITDTISDRVTATASLGIRPPSNAAVRAFTQIPVFEQVRVSGGRRAALFLGAVSRVAVMGPRVCSGYAIRWEVQCFDRTGKLITRTQRQVETGDVTAADKDEFKKAYALAMRAQPPENVKRALDLVQFAQERSAFGRFVPSTSGELWVGEFVVLESFIPGRRGTATPQKPTTWSVVGSDGLWVADVTLPARFALLDASRDYVTGIELDADDVESVVVYRIRK
jgi:hypothetical protein